MAYLDVQTVHNPATGTAAPAAWGDQVRDNLEFLIDPPFCSAFHSTTQSIVTSTETALAANSENFDNNAMHSTVTNNSRLTCQTAGRYQFTANVTWDPNATGYRRINFRVNGTTIFDGQQAATVVTGGIGTRMQAIRNIVLVATDYVECMVTQNSGGNLNATLTEFSAEFVTR